jgi:hypothetical protein
LPQPADHDSSARLHSLLEPSLASDEQGVQVPYSARAGFMVAFFGGVFAIVIFSALNAKRLGRMRQDLVPHILVGLLMFAAVSGVAYLDAQGVRFAIFELLGDAERGKRYFFRLVALGLFGLSYLLHRRYYRSADLMVTSFPNPWPWGIGSAVIGGALSLVALQLGKMLAQ